MSWAVRVSRGGACCSVSHAPPPFPSFPGELGLDFWFPGPVPVPGVCSEKVWSSEWCLVLMAGERLRRSGSERYCPPASSVSSSPGFRCGVGVGSRDGSGGEWVGCFGSGLGGLLVCGVSWQGLRLVGVGVERAGVGVGVRVVVLLLLFTVVWSGCWPTSDTTPIGRVFFLVRITLRTARAVVCQCLTSFSPDL